MHARSVGQLLDLAVDLFVQRFAATVGLTFLMWLPVRLLWVLLQDSESADLTLFHSFATFTVQALAVALAIQVIYAELQGRRIGMRQPLMGALRRAPALLVMTGITSVCTIAGVLCCVVPGVFLAYLWSVAPAALVLEGLGPIASLRRSQKLVRRHFGRWAGVMICAVLLQLPYESVVLTLDTTWAAEGFRDLGIPHGVYLALQAVLSAFLLAISSAAWATVATTFYLDCRVRSEGFDLAMRLERLQQAEAPARARAL